MGLFDAIDIAGSGLSAERVALDVTAENLANAQTTRTAGGQPYQRQEVLLAQAQPGGFGNELAGAMNARGLPGAAGLGATRSPGGVEVAAILQDPTPDHLIYDPSSPDANAQGYVRMPNVDTATEMTNLIASTHAYQADVTAMQTAKSMFTTTLGLLK
jgi:flagellar basal-body rod protein FlgC